MKNLPSLLTFNNIVLPDAASFVRCSSVFRKSICALDLSVLEFSFYKRHINSSSRSYSKEFLIGFFNREEDIRKLLVKDRKILYDLNLDIPQRTEHSLRDAYILDFHVDSRSFQDGCISVPNDWYREILQEFVLLSVIFSKNKFWLLSNLLKNERQLHSFWGSSLCVVRYDLGVICFESNHTGITKGVIFGFDNRGTALSKSPKVSNIYTYGGFKAQGLVDNAIYIIHEMIVNCSFQFIPSLLKYGLEVKFDENGYKQLQKSLIMEELLEEDKADFVAEKKLSTRRSYLLMQILHILSFIDEYPELGDNALEVLRMVWRSIPDPVFSRDEIQHALDSVLERDHLAWLITVYKYIVDELPVKTQPRSLQHLARVSVRRALADNQSLPGGLDCLGLLPLPVLDLLRLEK